MDDIYKKLSEERKKAQDDGTCPEWVTTPGYQILKEKYLYKVDTVKDQFIRIAKCAADKLPERIDRERFFNKFFELLWNGWLSPSTPVLANMGTDRGMPVSCSGGYIGDSIDAFYSAQHEAAMLTKNGFGTSGYLGDIRSRGSVISKGGKASGISPVFKSFIQVMRDVAQGTSRRGAWAGYLELEHPDFDEIADYVLSNPDDANVGWNITDAFIAALDANDPEAIRKYQKALKLKMVTGKGYFFKIDEANRHAPQMYKDHGLTIKASNLCSEISLCSDQDHTFTCVLSSMNISKYDEWKDTDAVFYATVFLDCVAEEFIRMSKDVPGLDKARRFTEKSRALGLGQCGFATYLQKKMIAFESFEAHQLNIEIAHKIMKEAKGASVWMAKEFGIPEWCKGYGVRNTHLIAIAPTKTTADIQGGISEGISPDAAFVFTKPSAAGELERIAPVLLEVMKSRGVFTKATIREIKDANGSVQGVKWLSDEEKKVFKTAFEINQEAIIRMAAARQRYVDQSQSLNLFFAADESPEWISWIHKEAFKNRNIISLYYIYSTTTVKASKGDCEACQ